jgi:hypothetical protein
MTPAIAGPQSTAVGRGSQRLAGRLDSVTWSRLHADTGLVALAFEIGGLIASASEGAAGKRACVLAGVDHETAVDEDVIDARG